MAIEIDTPLQYLKGVGPKLGDVLAKRGLQAVGDLVEWFPRAYEDRRVAQNISGLMAGQVVSLVAHVRGVRSFNLGRSRRKMYEVVVQDSTGRIACKYFRVPYKGYFERFQPGSLVRVMGKVTEYRGQKEFHHPDIHPVQQEEPEENKLIPLYTETEGLAPQKIRKLIEQAIHQLNSHPEGFPDPLPGWLREKYNLIGRAQAIREIHIPLLEQAQDLMAFKAPAQRRLIFEEFFWMELRLALRRSGIEREAALPIESAGVLAEKLKRSLPFQLTSSQIRVYQEIIGDLKKNHPMHRLLQGDVGSGKTLVAFMAAAHAAEAGFQTALMVPTEILAEQHYNNAVKLLEPLGLKAVLLTGSHKGREKAERLGELAEVRAQVCIGTHALIQDEVQFKQLGLVVIDEQHRFGVEQRHLLKKKGVSPHFLVMTATPIPRTLALSVYGDLDVSIMNERPAGRQTIVTRKTFESKRPQVFGFVKDQLKQGRQAYIIYPLVEESEKIDLKNALEEFENLQTVFSEYEVGLLHGRMKSKEKDEIMERFRRNEIQVLVSTTVIEVGVDVPNANIIVIEHAERFGLSQLHQLRGRVGRGSHKSYCVLILGYAQSEEAQKRAEIMEQTDDGFKIAEADLELRGPGEFLGTRQSGLPGFKMAHLLRDVLILQEARQAAFELVRRDPDLGRPEHQNMRRIFAEKEKNYIG